MRLCVQLFGAETRLALHHAMHRPSETADGGADGSSGAADEVCAAVEEAVALGPRGQAAAAVRALAERLRGSQVRRGRQARRKRGADRRVDGGSRNGVKAALTPFSGYP